MFLISSIYILVSLLFKWLRTVLLIKFIIIIKSTRVVIIILFLSIPFIFKDIIKKSKYIFIKFKRLSSYNNINSSIYIYSSSYINSKL